MSQSEIDRFVGDLQANDALRAEIESASGVQATAGIAARHGYGFALEEFRVFIKAKVTASGNDLSDEELEQVAGGATPEQHGILLALLGARARM